MASTRLDAEMLAFRYETERLTFAPPNETPQAVVSSMQRVLGRKDY